MSNHKKPVNNQHQEPRTPKTMHVRMLNGIAGPGFRAKPQQIIEADTDEALRLIESGNAVAVTAAEIKEDERMPVLGEYRRRVEGAQRRAAETRA